MASAPGRTLVQLVDRPFTDQNGNLSAWAMQFLQRLVDYIGPVNQGGSSGGGSGSGTTLTQQITNISEQLQQLSAGQGIDGASLGRLRALEMAPEPLAPPAPPAPFMLMPLAPLQSNGGEVVENEGTGLYVLDVGASNSGTAVLRSLLAGPGVALSYSTDGLSIVISTTAPLTSDGLTLTSAGNTLTSG